MSAKSNWKHHAVYLLGASAAGACTGFLLGWTRNSGDLYSADFKKAVVLSTICYFVAGLSLSLTGRSRMFKVPVWLLIAILGSVLSFTTIVLVPNEIDTWRLNPDVGLVAFLVSQFKEAITDLIINVIVDSFIAIPIMAVFHFLNAKLINRVDAT
jgi:hypothetical protein